MKGNFDRLEKSSEEIALINETGLESKDEQV